MTSDFTVKIIVKNGRLLRAIRERFGTVGAMRRVVTCSTSSIYGLLSMRISPVNESGEWSRAAFDISSALHMEPEDIWPAHIASLKIKRNEAEIDMSVEDVQDMLSADRYGPAMKALARWAKDVQPRDMRALIMQSNGADLDDVRADLKVSRERARQRIERAKRRIRERAEKDGVRSSQDVKL